MGAPKGLLHSFAWVRASCAFDVTNTPRIGTLARQKLLKLKEEPKGLFGGTISTALIRFWNAVWLVRLSVAVNRLTSFIVDFYLDSYVCPSMRQFISLQMPICLLVCVLMRTSVSMWGCSFICWSIPVSVRLSYFWNLQFYFVFSVCLPRAAYLLCTQLYNLFSTTPFVIA